jgi:hypothetical protein
MFLINYQKKRAVRKNRAEEEMWQLSRFYPIIEVQIKLTQIFHIKYVLILCKLRLIGYIYIYIRIC